MDCHTACSVSPGLFGCKISMDSYDLQYREIMICCCEKPMRKGTIPDCRYSARRKVVHGHGIPGIIPTVRTDDDTRRATSLHHNRTLISVKADCAFNETGVR